MRKLTITCGLLLASAPLLMPSLSMGGASGVRYVAIASAQAAQEPPADKPADAPKADAPAATDAPKAAEAVEEVAPEELAEKAYAALEKNCSSCHGAGKRQNKAAPVDRASHSKLIENEDAVVPGQPDKSPLYTLMLDTENPMPPKRVEQKPSVEEIEAIRLWIEKGAPAPKAAAE